MEIKMMFIVMVTFREHFPDLDSIVICLIKFIDFIEQKQQQKYFVNKKKIYFDKQLVQFCNRKLFSLLKCKLILL